MDYQSFLSYVQSNILRYLNIEEEVVAEVRQSYKNNGVVLDGLSIRRSDEKMTPNLYLNGYYEEYKNGRSLDSIMLELADQYLSLDRGLEVNPDDIYDFDSVKEHIILRLVGSEKNQKLLENAPYIPYEDLAITFRWLVNMDDMGVATMLIQNRELNKWGISVDELYEIALANTKRLFPPVLRPLGNMLVGYLKDIVDKLSPETCSGIQDEVVEYMAGERLRQIFYVLTNEQGINGATCMLYPDVIADFAKMLRHDLYILPSSIHEVILVPDTEELSAELLHDMVKEANDTVVFDSEILSDSVYYYSRNEKAVKKLYDI